MVRQPVRIVLVLACSLLLGACAGSPAPAPETGTSSTGTAHERIGSYREVTFAVPGGERRSGRLFGDGRVAVVLSHMGRSGDSQDDWSGFAEELARHGYRALTYARAADAERNDFADHWQDVLGATAFLRDNGADTVIAGGASIGAVASLHAAAQPDNGINAVLWLAGVRRTDSYEFTEAGVASIRCPIMFVSGDEDAYGSVEAARQLHAWAPTGELRFIESTRHGTDILTEDEANAGRLGQVMLEFVESAADQVTTC
ncbi:alpha/beta hydrolase [Amycolatopsis palatopharyngis]|uniref:alpha/beta hydrolase n=1 Tax=Amycolatopsis palatopharyngis TaxID=187982 RepID=UPI000E224EE1|nr:hypothetical protein [Amycolatopsis palatopharyngis]